MKSRPADNPPVRFRDVTVTYDEGDGPPPARITLLEDQSRSILSRNDSPDLCFNWSANPYRGCLHACSYCLSGDTRILMASSRTKLMRDVYPGDEVVGTVLDGHCRYYRRTKVKDVWTTLRVAYRITLADGTELVASGNHRFLTNRGWKYVMPFEAAGQRPFLTFNNSLVGVGGFATPYEESWEYRAGYLCGMVRGDAHFQRYKYKNNIRHRFRLALIDLEALHRTKRYLEEVLVEPREFLFQAAAENYKPVWAIHTQDRRSFERIESQIVFPTEPDIEWRKGFLAGIFDAEGSRTRGVFRISNSDETLLRLTMESMQKLGFDVVLEPPYNDQANKPVSTVRMRGGLPEHLRFLHTTGPAITRKWDLEGVAVKHWTDLRVVSIEKLGLMQLFDMSTETGDFVANGVISHNCYARPNHEYLDMGAGTDFDTKIVVKRRAPSSCAKRSRSRRGKAS